MKNETPADAAKTSEFKREEKFVTDLVESFKDFVLDSMAEGMHKDFGCHFDFVKTSFDTWLEIELDEGE